MYLKYQSSVLFVKDIEVSKEFYRDILGQEIGLDLGINIGFKCGIAIWQKDKANEIIFKNPNIDLSDNSNKNLELYFESDKIIDTEKELEVFGVRFIHKIHKEPWQQLTMRFYDPDGNVIQVGESMEALVRRLYKENNSIKEIAEKTTLPLDYVESLLL